MSVRWGRRRRGRGRVVAAAWCEATTKEAGPHWPAQSDASEGPPTQKREALPRPWQRRRRNRRKGGYRRTASTDRTHTSVIDSLCKNSTTPATHDLDDRDEVLGVVAEIQEWHDAPPPPDARATRPPLPRSLHPPRCIRTAAGPTPVSSRTTSMSASASSGRGDDGDECPLATIC